jgi:type VI secretion system protein ImpK
LARQDSLETADCVEVYALCLLLGLKGKYALRSAISYGQTGNGDRSRPSGEIKAIVRQCREKINRIRGDGGFLPDRELPAVKQTLKSDAFSRALGVAALILFVVLLLTFVGARIALSSGASQLG